MERLPHFEHEIKVCTHQEVALVQGPDYSILGRSLKLCVQTEKHHDVLEEKISFSVAHKSHFSLDSSTKEGAFT
jgi:hypothetical protein